MPARSLQKPLKSPSTRKTATPTSHPQVRVSYVGQDTLPASAWRAIQVLAATFPLSTPPAGTWMLNLSVVGSVGSVSSRAEITCSPTHSTILAGFVPSEWRCVDASTTSALPTRSSTRNESMGIRWRPWPGGGRVPVRTSDSCVKLQKTGASIQKKTSGNSRRTSSAHTAKRTPSAHSPRGKS